MEVLKIATAGSAALQHLRTTPTVRSFLRDVAMPLPDTDAASGDYNVRNVGQTEKTKRFRS